MKFILENNQTDIPVSTMNKQLDDSFHTLHFKHSGDNLYLKVMSNDNQTELLKATLAHSFMSKVAPEMEISDGVLEISWKDQGHLTVLHDDLGEGRHKYYFQYVSFKSKKLLDMFDMRGAHWYGGSQVRRQLWPIEKWSIPLGPYVADDSFKDGKYGGVQERYFFNSKGVSIFIDPVVPLFVAVNEADNKQLTLVSKYEYPYNEALPQTKMNYTIFQGNDLKDVHLLTAKMKIDKPLECADELVFTHPIWSTWAVFKKSISYKIVLEYANKILAEGFKSCQFEIDDDWTPRYGDNEFDKNKFPNPAEMVRELKNIGFRVTLWVHPFASATSSSVKQDYWLRNYKGGYTTWWNGIGKCLDVTNPKAREWYTKILQDLMAEVGVDSYKFDAGEVNWLPSSYTAHQTMATPNEYPGLYAQMCYEIEPKLKAQEVRVGVGTQRLPIFIRMMDKESSWGYENGLKTLIPHALTFGLIGYPFVLPDMVGGNAYNGMPDRELYIRWIEANALLPCVQISIPPWQYDEEVVRISKKMLQLHERYAPLIIQLAKESTQNGYPIVRPLWWIDPLDVTCQTLDSEFMLGDNLLVAPVLDPGMLKRAIYLPKGNWQCQLTNKTLEGGLWYDDYEVMLDDLPHFLKI